MQTELARIGTLIAGAKSLLLTMHPEPDGDALGSAAALAGGLSRLGKRVEIYCPEEIPSRFLFMMDLAVVTTQPVALGVDVTVLLDCTDTRSISRLQWPRERFGVVVALDHHETLHEFADHVYRDPKAAAAGLVVYRLCEAMGWEIDALMAQALYCAIVSDTGSFRYQNTSGEALRVAAELVDRGVDPWRVSSNLAESRPAAHLHLLGRVLQTLEISGDGAVAFLRVDQKMLEDTGCDDDATDGFINFARGIEGVEVAMLERSQAKELRVSLRSRGRVDVAAFASGFGGGGHHNAAGFDTALASSALRERLLYVVREEFAGENG
ncbi:MAG: DHH family phosphoesterase [Deltaproteobacteria bacterium]|nr:DHH family phosphoesterase [Deltaproteobacteria bacterium]